LSILQTLNFVLFSILISLYLIQDVFNWGRSVCSEIEIFEIIFFKIDLFNIDWQRTLKSVLYLYRACNFLFIDCLLRRYISLVVRFFLLLPFLFSNNIFIAFFIFLFTFFEIPFKNFPFSSF